MNHVKVWKSPVAPYNKFVRQSQENKLHTEYVVPRVPYHCSSRLLKFSYFKRGERDVFALNSTLE